MATEGQGTVSPQRIMQMAWGYAPPLIVEAALRNGVFDQLDKGAKTLEEVSAATGASVRGLRAIMNALVGIELLDRLADGKYQLTPESSTYLVSTKPSYFGGFLRHTSSRVLPRWLELDTIARTGGKTGVNSEEQGTEFFREFVQDLFPLSYPVAQVLAKELRLAEANSEVRVLDVAAGSGVWGIGLAQRSKQVKVTALDWQGVLEITRDMVVRFGLSDQFSYIAGDLETADFGSGYQVATLGHILHAIGEPRSRVLLKTTFDALAPGGTIAIQEFLVDEDRRGPAVALFFAVNMLVNTEEGDTWSFGEISGWLREAGFVDARLLDAPGPSPLILANRPK